MHLIEALFDIIAARADRSSLTETHVCRGLLIVAIRLTAFLICNEYIKSQVLFQNHGVFYAVRE